MNSFIREFDSKRVSTSCQTHYQEFDKIIIPKSVDRVSYRQSQDFQEKGGKIKNACFKLSLSETEELRQVKSKQPYLISFLPSIKEKSLHPRHAHQRYSPKGIKPCGQKKNSSIEPANTLFQEGLKSYKKKRNSQFAMHKTFFDIIEELNERLQRKGYAESF